MTDKPNDSNINEEQSIEYLAGLLRQSGLKFRIKSPNEEGGFFYMENRERKKFNENIFIKRSAKYER